MKKKVVVVRTSAGLQQEGLQPVGLLPSVGAQVGADNVQPCTPQLWSSLPTPLQFTARNLETLFGNILCNMEWLTRALSRKTKAQVPSPCQQERRKTKHCVSTPTQSSEHSLHIMLHNQILTPPPSGKMSTTTLLKPFSTQPLLSCAAKPLTLCLTQQSSRGTLSHKLAGLVSTVICSDNKVIEPVRAQQEAWKQDPRLSHAAGWLSLNHGQVTCSMLRSLGATP